MDLPEIVRTIDICTALGVAPGTVRSWIRAGRIPQPKRVTYHLRIWNREDLLPYLKSLHASAAV